MTLRTTRSRCQQSIKVSPNHLEALSIEVTDTYTIDYTNALPIEIVSKILGMSIPNPDTPSILERYASLRSYSLVNRVWHSVAQNYLAEHVDLNDDRPQNGKGGQYWSNLITDLVQRWKSNDRLRYTKTIELNVRTHELFCKEVGEPMTNVEELKLYDLEVNLYEKYLNMKMLARLFPSQLHRYHSLVCSLIDHADITSLTLDSFCALKRMKTKTICFGKLSTLILSNVALGDVGLQVSELIENVQSLTIYNDLGHSSDRGSELTELILRNASSLKTFNLNHFGINPVPWLGWSGCHELKLITMTFFGFMKLVQYGHLVAGLPQSITRLKVFVDDAAVTKYELAVNFDNRATNFLIGYQKIKSLTHIDFYFVQGSILKFHASTLQTAAEQKILIETSQVKDWHDVLKSS